MISSPPLYVHGYGCVSTAGIGNDATYQACSKLRDIPLERRERSVDEQTVSSGVRPVDLAALRAAMPKHPRLRRSSNVTKFAITAAAEALGPERIQRVQKHEFRLGIVMSFINGCVNYSNRFYTEVLADPSLSSPILFPETVYNAPASHVASYLNCDGPVYTMIGDPAALFTSVNVARGWLATSQVDGCLVLCAEELDWLSYEALELQSRQLHATEGAAAFYLEKDPSGIELDIMRGPYDYTDNSEKRDAISEAWKIAKESEGALLVDGLTGVSGIDRDEEGIVGTWSGDRISPAVTLGTGMGVGCGFQNVVALEALNHGNRSSIVLASGTNQHSFSARFSKR